MPSHSQGVTNMTVADEFEKYCKDQQIENPFCTRAKLHLGFLISKEVAEAFKAGMRHELHNQKAQMMEMLRDTSD